jgi:predicted DCC family thiol-disulfide oxidoreductase YuxK
VTLARPVLLYDKECRFCRWSARLVVRFDARQALAVLPLQDELAEPLLEPMSEGERLSVLRLVESDGRIESGGAATARVLEHLGLPGALGRAARAPRRAAHLDRFYSLIARHRSELGRIVPDGPAPRRFP